MTESVASTHCGSWRRAILCERRNVNESQCVASVDSVCVCGIVLPRQIECEIDSQMWRDRRTGRQEQWRNQGFRRPGQKEWSAPPNKVVTWVYNANGPFFCYWRQGTLWLPELSFFSAKCQQIYCKTAPHQYINVETQKALRPNKPDECIVYYI